MYKAYTGIGSRETPEDVVAFMSLIASILEKKGWTLRSGAADGADLAFENGVISNNKEIYLPWRGFNNSNSTLYLYTIDEKAYEMAADNHPGWKYLKDPVRKLMARNVYQVLGNKLDVKSKFVICWTPDGCESHETRTNKTGGTGLAISLASKLDIPIFNLCNESSIKRLLNLLSEDELSSVLKENKYILNKIGKNKDNEEEIIKKLIAER